MRLTLALLLLAAPLAAQRPKKPVRRIPVTAEHLRTAFGDAGAQRLLERAREARLSQDSALKAYDARSFLRVSVGLAMRRLGRERLLFRSELASRVRWSRASGAWIEPLGRRSAFPMGTAMVDMSAATPIPYYPGKETLWVPFDAMGAATERVEVDENEMLHPLATGAEAYYRYTTGDSASIRLPDARVISLRELRITARTPSYKAFVGSFWFDTERGNLVRAAYRLAADFDIWQNATDDQKQQLAAAIEKAQRDTSRAAQAAVRAAQKEMKESERGRAIGSAIMGDMRARLTGITVEYGLHQGRFWLPRAQVAEGEGDFGFVRVPMRFEESFRYDGVNGDLSIPPVPKPGEMGLALDDSTYTGGGAILLGTGTPRDSARMRERRDSTMARYARTADSLQVKVNELRAKGDTSEAREVERAVNYFRGQVRAHERRQVACARGDSSYLAGIATRADGAVRMAVRMPCDTAQLSRSPELPGSIYGDNEAVFGTTERDALLGALDFGLQAPWSPQRPTLHTGLDMLRYNRIEGLSLGASATSELGLGYTARAEARLGVGDLVPNGELSLTRSNGRTEVRLGAFHRLGVANDDWGAPLAFGASLANLLYARDEGFYYRTFGLELAGLRDAPGPLGGATVEWRLFAERQRSAGVEPNTQASLGNAIGSAQFRANIAAERLSTLGAAADVVRGFGADPTRLRLDTRLRLEGGYALRDEFTNPQWGYGRFSLDATASRPLGRFSLGLTGAAGTSTGELPIQRAFYVGGLHTVRGQFARVDSAAGPGRVGDAFWLGRAELGLGRMLAARPSLFYDVGWAGPRADFTTPGRPLSGAGLGLSLLDGMLRLDLAKGIWPEKRWRFDVSVDARF